MIDTNNLKRIVQDAYGDIAQKSVLATHGCCGPSASCCGSFDFSTFSESYQQQPGYNPDADLSLGCGIPTQFAGLKKGQHVLDLGSGAGNDCFVALAFVGDEGSVTGIDFTPQMLAKARENAAKLNYTNVTFVEGDIEQMPLDDNRFDVVISNCVLNLVPNKQKAFAEIHRVLKPNAHFCVSDVVTKGVLPDNIREDVSMYAACVSGAITLDDYLAIIRQQGFVDVTIHKETKYNIDGLDTHTQVFSVTVSGRKVQ